MATKQILALRAEAALAELIAAGGSGWPEDTRVLHSALDVCRKVAVR